jgi:hypothetical protein
MAEWKKVDERTTASSFLRGALTFGFGGGGKTYTFENTETGETRQITAGGSLTDGYSLSDKELGERIARGEFDEKEK